MANLKLYQEQLSQLVAAPSVSCADPALDQSNHGVLSLLAEWLEARGFRCRWQTLPQSGKANLIAVKGEGSGGLVLSGHSDTVPCNPERWQQDDPWKLIKRDDRLFGLGATDMKGFFPTVMAALDELKALKLNAPIVILATADEESSMSGAHALSEADLLHPRFAIIGEPTGLRPIRMHKGIMMESLRIQGKSGHSSNPALGHNALEAMHDAIQKLMSLRNSLQKRYYNEGFEIKVPTMNLGCIHGGDSPNRICGQCELHFDFRALPGMDSDEIRQGIRQALVPIAEKHKVDIVLSSLFPGVAAFEQNAQSELVQYVENLSGHSAGSVAFATEAPFLQKLGAQTVVFGPGSIDQAHQPDEFISLQQVSLAIAQVRQLIIQYCALT